MKQKKTQLKTILNYKKKKKRKIIKMEFDN